MKNNLNTNKDISLRINLGTRPIFGHGKAKLLDAISANGSISAAARKIGMSYRRAWLLTDAMNQDFKLPLIVSSLGGKGGGGAKLTEAGVGLVGLAIVAQVIFGSSVAFLPGDVVSTLMGLIGSLGGAGLVGLITAGLLYQILK